MTALAPALTAEEWRRETDSAEFSRNQWDVQLSRAPSRHASAALALYGQPFGFTREDVRLLRLLLRDDSELAFLESEAERLTSLADRIEALLPPENA